MKNVCPPSALQFRGFLHGSPRMRATLLLAVWLVGVALIGCSHRGDFGTFFIQKVTEFGGQPKATVNLPVLEAKWTYEAEKNKFRVMVQGPPFAAVDAWLQQALGPPKMSVNAGPQGQPNRVWVAADIGVAVHCMGKPEGVEIICVRGSGGK